MGWNDILTLFNAVDTVLGLVVLGLGAERVHIWWKNRNA